MDGFQDLDKFKVNSDRLSVPNGIYYLKDFIDTSEEQALINSVLSSPKPKWTVLSNRRLQNWGGLPHPKGMVAEPLPRWLQFYTSKLASLNIFDGNVPNHVLINEYLRGQGIMAHEDGPLFYPTVATINTGSHTLLDFYSKSFDQQSNEFERRPLFSVLSEPRSLLILKGEAYKSYLHGIQEVTSDSVTDQIANLSLCSNAVIGERLERQTRYSFTIRYVPKVIKTNAIFSIKKA